jgi:polysaccharide pyruvyl transferase WcaK-like protein
VAHRIGLVGFFGWGNFGDELMLRLWHTSLGPVLDAAPVNTLLHRPYLDRPASVVADDFDAFLVGGGDLIIPDAMSPLYWRREWLRRPVVVSGVGVALERPGRADVVPRMAAFLCHPSVRRIGVRDQDSADWVTENCHPTVPVRSTPDLGFAWPMSRPAVRVHSESVAVVLRKTPTPADLASVARITRWAAARGLRTEHVILATGVTRDEELAGLRSVFGEDLAVVSADDVDGLCDLLAGRAAVFSAKFHGIVVSLRHGTPVVSLRRSHKTAALARSLGDPCLGLHVDDLDDARLDALLARRGVRPEVTRLEDEAAAEVHAVVTELAQT